MIVEQQQVALSKNLVFKYHQDEKQDDHARYHSLDQGVIEFY